VSAPRKSVRQRPRTGTVTSDSSAGDPGSQTNGGQSARRSVRDVAALARVSTGTVSNVLNRPHLVAPDTTERVFRAIEDLGFVRNASARQLRAGESRAVGAIVQDLSNAFFSEITRGIEDRLADEGLVLLLCSSHNSVETELRQLQVLEEQRVLGVLITPLSRDMAKIEALHRRGTRVVLLDREAPPGHFCSVAVDDVRGGELAVAHLLSQGYDRVGFINGPRAIRQHAERRRGAMQAIRDVGLDPKTTLIEVTIPSPLTKYGEQGVDMLAKMEFGLPSAIFCVNDQVALGVLMALRARGLSVPNDVAVVGYDDVGFAPGLATPLTSVRQPMYQLGHTATSLLLAETDDPHHRHERVRFTPELVVRASSQCGAPER
jgi:LacI family transcriptional regulator